MRELLAAYRDHEDLISIGAYRRGTNRHVDTAMDMQDDINRFLRQRIEEPVKAADASAALVQLHQRALAAASAATAPPCGNATTNEKIEFGGERGPWRAGSVMTPVRPTDRGVDTSEKLTHRFPTKEIDGTR